MAWKSVDNFVMQPQTQTNWCWAAVAASVAVFYDPASTAKQCDIADGELNRADCCGAEGQGACNVPSPLASPLYRVGHLERWAMHAASIEQLRAEIDGRRPLCVRIAWAGGGGHFIAVTAYLDNGSGGIEGPLVGIEDPWWGSSDIPYDTLRTSYRTNGAWTDSYYLR